MMKRKRRRPRRKKQIVDATQPSDIPYHKYRVEWIDILSDSGWAEEKEFNKMKLASPVNEDGFIIRIDTQLRCLLRMIKMMMGLLRLEIER